MAYLTSTSATGTSFADRASAAFQNIVTSYKQHRLYRETFNELSALSNRELADLGLNRSNLQQIARESSRITLR
ncbi:DUF1127 domain-containing protein [Sulfitobacter sp. M57]|uniref:DUF1127 domain-containing protein n=1 Tax=unclassified Sulfitobacter TaxID=196795 RepID=UPI0023E1E17C|nr:MULTISPECIES: DUF1127 domain-containing protein [unclassified Sulfitobacter]MDF3414140.1 DUF1127 domain-containing protein [Sulfitobacter sp. KE5]MDF3420579.1 DUF1127 domain-containing protein [Sulfitobacter sp. KE43]MDF3432686.1 DUF1127 domain-containing protein [Sulfitobacter sp. KE42]MDF3458325.1 DUF1127 domain-containing protein [Sulfitobacter sp. S74]MDF3462226.1 DUF1127 domain-containing protein [Sulfitobacter sp. Ks18]